MLGAVEAARHKGFGTLKDHGMAMGMINQPADPLTDGQRAHNLEALIDRVVTKPFSLREICEVVDEALRDRRARAH